MNNHYQVYSINMMTLRIWQVMTLNYKYIPIGGLLLPVGWDLVTICQHTLTASDSDGHGYMSLTDAMCVFSLFTSECL